MTIEEENRADYERMKDLIRIQGLFQLAWDNDRVNHVYCQDAKAEVAKILEKFEGRINQAAIKYNKSFEAKRDGRRTTEMVPSEPESVNGGNPKTNQRPQMQYSGTRQGNWR